MPTQSIETNIPKLRFPEYTDDWTKTTLEKLGETVSGLTYSPNDIRKDGLLVLRSSNVKNDVMAFEDCVYVRPDINGVNLVKQNDILICVRNGSSNLIGKNALIPENLHSAFGAFMTVFRAKNPHFIFQLFRTQKYKKQVYADLGARINSINNNQLKKYKFIVPNLNEQQKIASFLGAVDDKIAGLQKKKDLLEAYKKGMMQRLFSQSLRLTDTNGNPFPDWEEKKLDSIALVTMGTSPESRFYNENSLGLPLIQGNADVKNRRSAPRIFTSFTTKECFPNDILMSVRAPVGEISLSNHHACIGRGICAIKARNANVQGYIYQYLLWFEPKWKSLSQGSTFESVNTNDIKSLNIPLPQPNEQKKIADFLSAIDDKIALVSDELSHAKTFKKGLLQQMFV